LWIACWPHYPLPVSLFSFDKDFENLKEEDPFFADDAVYHGEVPSDLSEKHDDYSVD
jgi:hypothetical protein